jgi:arylsulfatase A-like enzyme
MTDQMQGRVLEPDHVCQTPNLDRLGARGVRLSRAYTPNAVCSPARASLMTGLLPHNHGVLEVIHCVDEDQCNLRVDKPHWAQRLEAAGYRTGYFGKWHVERTNDLARFGWQVDGERFGALFREHQEMVLGSRRREPRFSLSKDNVLPAGYADRLLYGVTDQPPEERGMGLATDLAITFLESVVRGPDPWCCFVSVSEPHDPFVAGEKAFAQYDVDAIPLPPNVDDDLSGPDVGGHDRTSEAGGRGVLLCIHH